MFFSSPADPVRVPFLPNWMVRLRLFRTAIDLSIEPLEVEPAAGDRVGIEILDEALWTSQEVPEHIEGEPSADFQPGPEIPDDENSSWLAQGWVRTETPGEPDGLNAPHESDVRIAELLGLVGSARELLLKLTDENNSQRAWLDLLHAENARLSNQLMESEGLVARLYAQMAELKIKLRTAKTKRRKLVVALGEASKRLKPRMLKVSERQPRALEQARAVLKDKSSEVLLAKTITL